MMLMDHCVLLRLLLLLVFCKFVTWNSKLPSSKPLLPLPVSRLLCLFLMPTLAASQNAAAQFFTLPFRKKRQSYTLNPANENYNVVYLGNVLTIMAKGQASVEKPLGLIWRTYLGRQQKNDMQMKLMVTRSGLKAETKQQGLTEYWAHRITYCLAPPEYPKVFCWVYKHEGKRMKPELRCHAVLCKKGPEPEQISNRLHEMLHAALLEYKREKVAMEKARRSSTASGSGVCRRKLMLQTGSLNFRPPVSRSKSAPRLGSIDEEEEEEDEDIEDAEENFSDWGSLCYRDTPVGDDLSTSSGSFIAPSSCKTTFDACEEGSTAGVVIEEEEIEEDEEEPEEVAASVSFRRHNSMTTKEREAKKVLSRGLSLEAENDGASASSCSSSSSDDLEIRRRLGSLVDTDAMSDESGYPDSMRTSSDAGSGDPNSAGSSSHGEDDFNVLYSDEEVILEEDLCDRMREMLSNNELATSL
ncbi:hypothetical protein L596_014540 [Steinernema carpocapsae]|uniref:PID domain-containing protein n=1 Tax=Steinernema carpocapsae TaxID=34508 RepID=A0A4U5ND08_STECR|nr:hypothetical protein L596_014540 [Steinernema carpocapsae]